MIDTAHLAGPIGGMLALAFGTGCASGYGFAIRTAYRAVKARLDAVERNAREDQFRCELKVLTLETRLRELEDMLLGRRPLGAFSPAPSADDLRAAQDIPTDKEN